jgi:biopolymer transport protein ExbD
MKAFLEELMNEKVDLPIAPLIDCVFLLLIYFMLTSSLEEPEADMGITLPGVLAQSKTLAMPDEQIIEVEADGRVILNGRDLGERGAKSLGELTATLIRFRQASEAAKTKALVTILGADDTLHERVIDVMNACAGAGIKNVTFGMGG